MVYTVEVALPATPPAVSSGESATLRLPLSIINDDALQTHAAERPRGRAVLYLFSIEHAEQRGEEEVPVPYPFKKKNQNPKLSNSLNRSLRSKHTQDLLPTTQHLHTHEPAHAHPQEEE